MIGYDLDGVLAQVPPHRDAKWSRMNKQARAEWQELLLEHYRTVQPLFDPPEQEFCVISARKNTEEIDTVTAEWLEKHFAGRIANFMLLRMPRNIVNVVNFKLLAIKMLNISEFTEDNVAVVRGLRKVSPPEVKIWLFDPKTQERTLEHAFPRKKKK